MILTRRLWRFDRPDGELYIGVVSDKEPTLDLFERGLFFDKDTNRVEDKTLFDPEVYLYGMCMNIHAPPTQCLDFTHITRNEVRKYMVNALSAHHLAQHTQLSLEHEEKLDKLDEDEGDAFTLGYDTFTCLIQRMGPANLLAV
jgi:hypothetical protein